MNINLFKKILMTLFIFLSVNINADEDEHSEHRHHEAHVHGQAEMNILIDDTTFVFEINSPALNLLGFEHEPGTDAEKETVHKVNKMLLDYKNIVAVADMDCKQSQNQMTAPFDEEDHDHNHHHGENHGDGHSEYYLFYSLSCKDIKKIEQIKIKLFDNFPGFESVDVKWTYFTDAGSMEATKEQKIIKIK
jgi:hypothetical protein